MFTDVFDTVYVKCKKQLTLNDDTDGIFVLRAHVDSANNNDSSSIRIPQIVLDNLSLEIGDKLVIEGISAVSSLSRDAQLSAAIRNNFSKVNER